MRTRKTIATMSALFAASSLALTACGDDEPDNEDTTSEEATDETEEPTDDASTEATESTSQAVPSGDLTPAGTELALGEAATVSFSSGDGSGTVQVVVDEITVGTPADLEPLDLGDQAAGFVPYYIQVTVTGVSGSAELGNYSINESIEGLLPDGEKAQTIYIIGDFAPCEEETFPGDFSDGASFETCVTYLAQESTEVAAAQYAPREGDYNSYDGEPVVWK
ncbi:hypothetical protein ACFQ0K_04655 [Nocardioides caeni]|uniref:Uncharacterized protein n=1 Tax=Nocardioides caeni TaxID=574700 RepID=A0A4S8N468_9ACTN|nr:hypothetical protein [Nocardioides caeni]THV10798.1 hypothetical protein E9934_13785 [Nocardioides caeni]